MGVWKYKQGDSYPPHRSTLIDGAGDPADLTSAAVTFILTPIGETTPVIEGPETGPDGGDLDDSGQVEYPWVYTETDSLIGHFNGEHVVTFPSGLVKRFPTVGFDRIYFYAHADDAGS